MEVASSFFVLVGFFISFSLFSFSFFEVRGSLYPKFATSSSCLFF